MRSTGLDHSYQCCGAANQLNYLIRSARYAEVSNLGNTSNLQPGDIFANSGHTFFYIGNGQEASASYGDRTASMGHSVYGQFAGYRIFRYVG